MIQRLATVAFVAAVILGSIWPMFLGDRIAFRDVNHFYLPLYDYVSERTAGEWLPFWNPLDHTGLPLIGEASTAVLYPVRYVVYSLPLTNEWLMNLYLVVHLMLASAGAAWMAKTIGCSRLGAVVAAIVYPLSGSVFALSCNPPFLVGAAWIPLALGACLSATAIRRRVVIAATALSMMVLGGDPQSALHCVITVVAIALLSTRGQLKQAKRSGHSWMRCEWFRSVIVSFVACVLAVGVSSIQIAASLDWSRQSVRAPDAGPRSEIYDFSLAPWHAIEVLSPRPFGDLFPVHRRVANLIPGEGRMWTPSIYAGLVVGFALLCRLVRPREYFAEPWFAVALIGLLICFGHFGVVWFLQQIPGVLQHSESAIGGPFWMLCNLIPGYSSFRYPVKWLPIFAIAGSMVAAQWIATERDRIEGRVATALLAAFVIAVVGAHLAIDHWARWYPIAPNELPIDEYWGRLDVTGGLVIVRRSCLWTVAILLPLIGLRWFAVPIRERFGVASLACAWAILIAIDSVAAASTLLPTVNISQERQLSHQASPPPIPKTRVLRTQRGMWPQRWRQSHSDERALEVAASERMAWFGRWHLVHRQAVFNSMVSIKSRSYREFWSACNQHLGDLDFEQRRVFWRQIRQWLAIGAVSHVDGKASTAAGGMTLVAVDRKTTEPVDRVRVFTRWMPEKPLREFIGEFGRIDEDSLADGNRDGGRVPLPHVAIAPPSADPGRTARVRRTTEGAIVVECNATCLLERCVYQDGNWNARLTPLDGGPSRSRSVFRSSHLNQAVAVPAGKWIVSFEYRPWWKRAAIFATILSAILLGILARLPNQFVNPTVRGIVFFLIRGRLLRSFRPSNRNHQ
ncbi:hypothetical protein Mal15_32560 [Stieleria maiorica]|uniref:Bacterial membrane protein YfhO n=1 Tax=Stieleria maiorica TaxID=2795974 RepID=A0A5B9MHY8_9BACT|nr:hypothetical protein [Stieleria maiorica]QEF99195.1 hypothetical protein Mal15_32560 [Stieleria maiorica]